MERSKIDSRKNDIPRPARILSFIWRNFPLILQIVMVTWATSSAVGSVGRFFPSGFYGWESPVMIFLALSIPFVLGYLTAVLLIEED